MVTKLGFNGYLSETLNYNEKKVQQGKAEVLDVSNFLQDKDKLSFHDKFERLDHLNQLRPDVTVNTLHAKISFHPTDAISDEKLKEIADTYMKKLGFENQPYIVYKHQDTAVPHLHVVSTIVEPNGHRIETHNMGKDASEQARKEIEIQFGIEKAADHKQEKEYSIKPIDVLAVKYGEVASKDAMKQVIRMTIENFKVGSIEELNAILRTYNITADRGSEMSRTRQHGGLHYKILDEKGHTVGTPIKASAFYFKPTLKKLEEKFEKDKELRKKDFPEIKSKIDRVLAQKPKDITEFIKGLEKENIKTLARINKNNQIYGLTYIDYDKKVVVNGSTLDKQYGANRILQTFQLSHRQIEEKDSKQVAVKKNESSGEGSSSSNSSSGSSKGKEKSQELQPSSNFQSAKESLAEKSFHQLAVILAYTEGYDDTPHQLKKDKKKRKTLHH